MRTVNRRDAARLAAGLGIGLSLVEPDPTQAQTDKPQATPLVVGQAPDDCELEQATRSPQSFIMTERGATQLPDRYAQHDLKVTSVRPTPEGTVVSLRPQTLKVFRVDADVDDFARGGGIYWEIGPPKDPFKGRTQLNAPPILVTPGLLMMAIRNAAGLVRWYSLEPDLRC